METEESDVEPVKENAQPPEKTGLTPDKIDLAACKTPAKKDDQTASSSDDSKDAEKKSAPTMTMRFVDETVETSKEDTSREENKKEEENMETDDNSKGGGDAFDDMLKGKKADEKNADKNELIKRLAARTAVANSCAQLSADVLGSVVTH